MRTLAVVATLALLASVLAYHSQYTGEAWQDKSGSSKQSTLMGQVRANEHHGEWYTARVAELFTEDLSKSFTSVMDSMPAQTLGLEERPKLIHTIGGVANAKWVSNGKHNFTGMFQGCDNLMLRFSLAQDPDNTKPKTAPSIAVKFLANGVPSANIFLMYSLVGQDSANLFEHDMSNHPPTPNAEAKYVPFSGKLLIKAFGKVSKYPSYMGLSTVARFDQNGNEIDVPKMPYRLIFHPVTSAHNMAPSPWTNNTFFLDQLSRVPTGKLFEVYAEPEPTTDHPLSGYMHIGSIVTTTGFTPSLWGDKTMFFQHIYMEQDLSYNPDWTAGTNADMANQQSYLGEDPPLYKDLPFN